MTYPSITESASPKPTWSDDQRGKNFSESSKALLTFHPHHILLIVTDRWRVWQGETVYCCTWFQIYISYAGMPVVHSKIHLQQWSQHAGETVWAVDETPILYSAVLGYDAFHGVVSGSHNNKPFYFSWCGVWGDLTHINNIKSNMKPETILTLFNLRPLFLAIEDK